MYGFKMAWLELKTCYVIYLWLISENDTMADRYSNV